MSVNPKYQINELSPKAGRWHLTISVSHINEVQSELEWLGVSSGKIPFFFILYEVILLSWIVIKLIALYELILELPSGDKNKDLEVFIVSKVQILKQN